MQQYYKNSYQMTYKSCYPKALTVLQTTMFGFGNFNNTLSLPFPTNFSLKMNILLKWVAIMKRRGISEIMTHLDYKTNAKLSQPKYWYWKN